MTAVIFPMPIHEKKECNFPGHHDPYDKDLEELFRRVAEIDNIVVDYLREVDQVMQYPPKAFRSYRGMLTLEKKYGRDRLVAACTLDREACKKGIRTFYANATKLQVH